MEPHIEYIKRIACPMEDLVKQLNENPNAGFACKNLIETVKNAENTSAHVIQDGKEVPLPKREMLAAIYRMYVVTLYTARPNCEILNSLIKHMYEIDKKLFSPVDPTKKLEFINSFNEMLRDLASSEYWNTDNYQEAIELYLNIWKK